MDEDGFFIEFLSAEFGPDKSEEEPQEEDDDGLDRVGGNWSEGDCGSSDEGATVAKLLDNTNTNVGTHGQKDFFVTFFDYGEEPATPFANGGDDDKIGDAIEEIH